MRRTSRSWPRRINLLHTIQVYARNADGTQGPLLGTVTSNSGIFVFNPTPTGVLVQELAKDAATIQKEQALVAQVFQTQSIGQQFLQAPDNTKTAQNSQGAGTGRRRANYNSGSFGYAKQDRRQRPDHCHAQCRRHDPDEARGGGYNGSGAPRSSRRDNANTVVEAGVTTTNVPFAGTPATGGNVLDNFVNVDAGVGDILSVKNGHMNQRAQLRQLCFAVRRILRIHPQQR